MPTQLSGNGSWSVERPTASELKRIFMPSHFAEDRIINHPMKVRMFGWESDTLELQHSGWQLSMKQDVQHNAFQLALHHPHLKLFAISRHYDDFHFMQIARDPMYARKIIDHFVFDIEHLSSRIEVILHEGAFDSIRHPLRRFWTFSPVDGEPQWERLERRQSLEDYMLFRPINHSKDIIVDPNDVPQLMEMILKAQSPQQEEIRQRQRSRENMAYVIDAGLLPGHDIHAQIVTIAA